MIQIKKNIKKSIKIKNKKRNESEKIPTDFVMHMIVPFFLKLSCFKPKKRNKYLN